MAFLPEENFFEEDLILNYDLSTGTADFESEEISKFTTISLQFIFSEVSGPNLFLIQQSNDLIAWSDISDVQELPVGVGNFMIDKGIFSGKYVRVSFLSTEVGILSIKLLAKR